MSAEPIPIPLDLCGRCGFPFNGVIDPDESPRPPGVGDFGICSSCGNLSRIDENGVRRDTTCADVACLSPEQVLLVQDAQRYIHRRGRLPVPDSLANA